MLFWFLLALMTGAAVFSVLWPLGFQRSVVVSANAADMAVYRDQLSEVKNDRARGLIAGPEAEAARIEIVRRLIGASNDSPDESLYAGSLGRRRVASIVALVGIPAAALLLYLAVGSPGLPGMIAADRASPSAPADFSALLARVENHLAGNLDDGRGWELLAPLYLRLGRTADAVKARGSALRILGENRRPQSGFWRSACGRRERRRYRERARGF